MKFLSFRNRTNSHATKEIFGHFQFDYLTSGMSEEDYCKSVKPDVDRMVRRMQADRWNATRRPMVRVSMERKPRGAWAECECCVVAGRIGGQRLLKHTGWFGRMPAPLPIDRAKWIGGTVLTEAEKKDIGSRGFRPAGI